MRHLFRGMVGLLVAASIATTGCYTVAIDTKAARDGVVHSEPGWNWFWGISKSRKIAHECPHGLAKVETSFPWYGIVVTVLTLGIVVPQWKRYTCATPQSKRATSP